MKARICLCFSSSQSPYYFLRGQLEYLASNGFDITLVVPDDGFIDQLRRQFDGVRVLIVPLERRIAPLADARALFRLWQLFRSERFDIVHLHTPKASLLGSLAARAAGQKTVIYHVHGLVSLRYNRVARPWLARIERIPFRLSDKVLCVSASLARFCVDNDFVASEKISVLESGSINGIDTSARFNPERLLETSRSRRRSLGLQGRFVLGYLGRMAPDKGMAHLVEAVGRLQDRIENLSLLLVGPNELSDDWPAVLRSQVGNVDLRLIDRTDRPEEYLSVIDVLLFPSSREGFGLVLAEANAMRVPAVAYDIVGVRDAVSDGCSATLVEAGNVSALADAVVRYHDDDELRTRHGREGRNIVVERFVPERLWRAQADFYSRLLEEQGEARPPSRLP